MLRFLHYFGQFQAFRGRMGGFPGWARVILLLFALPGLLLLGLSIVAVLVSILSLLLLTVPVYRLLSWAMRDNRTEEFVDAEVMSAENVEQNRGAGVVRRGIEVKIVD